MKHSVEHTLLRLHQHDVPELLIDIAKGGKAPGRLSFEWSTPSSFYWLAQEFPGYMPYEDCLLPLWETNGSSVTALVDDGSNRVIKYYFEDSADDYQELGIGVQSAMRHTLKWLVLECQHAIAEIADLVKLVGLDNGNVFIQELSEKREGD